MMNANDTIYLVRRNNSCEECCCSSCVVY